MATKGQPYGTETLTGSDADRRRPAGVDDATLFARFMAGEQKALMDLFDRHHHRIYIYCLKIVGSHEVAQDLAQEMWEQVIRYCATQREIKSPIALMLTIARNLCFNHLKIRNRYSSLNDLPESDHPPVVTHELSQMEELVVLSLPKLPLNQQEVLVLHDYCGYSFDDIARMLGEGSGSLRMRASRARSNLGRIISSMLALEEDHEQSRNESTDTGERGSE